MLELIKVSKTYKTGKNVKVEALKDVTLSFPERGLVFIIGKSGSGKSTLLNLIGGLDGSDAGKIIINGKSAESFTAGDYDAFRNAFVGFVFQEYNLIETFSVFENIKIAADLQNKCVKKEDIDGLLEKLDMPGLAERMPRELSSGQRQRVAIARALVKEAGIILADEPTGSLDSETGKQIIEILKSLSQEKLVIVVSHDLELAKRYADRIITLKDGRAVEDTGSFSLPGREEASEEPRIVKSRFSMRNAYRIARGDILRKPWRLALITILLSFSFMLFGISHTISSYDTAGCAAATMREMDIDYLALERVDYSDVWGDIILRISDGELKELKKKYPDYKFFPVVPDCDNLNQNYFFDYDEDVLSYSRVTGGLEINEELSAAFGLSLYAGRYPESYDEIAVSKCLYEVFKKRGYRGNLGMHGHEYKAVIEKPEDLIGRGVSINGRYYKIAGIIDTDYDDGRYLPLNEHMENELRREILEIEFYALNKYSIHNMVFFREGYINEEILKYKRRSAYSEISFTIPYGIKDPYGEDQAKSNFYAITVFQELPERVYWTDGIERTALEENEVLLPIFPVVNYYPMEGIPSFYDELEELASELINDFARDHFDEIKEEFSNMFLDGKCTYLDYAEFISLTLENEYHPGMVREYFENQAEEFLIYEYYIDHFDTVSLEVKHKSLQSDYDLKVAGFYSEQTRIYPIMMSEEMYEKIADDLYLYDYGRVLIHFGGNSVNKGLLEYVDDNVKHPHFKVFNEAVATIRYVDSVLEKLSLIAFVLAFVFAFLSAFLLYGYVRIAISARQKDIGILRALGARMTDLMRIFFLESLFVGLIASIIASAGCFAISEVGNAALIRNYGLLVSALDFGIIQILLIMGISAFIAFLSTFIPVYRYSKKKPAEVITRIL